MEISLKAQNGCIILISEIKKKKRRDLIIAPSTQHDLTEH